MGEHTSSGIKDRVERGFEQIDQISSPQEAQARVAILPLTAVHEARYAIQKLKDKYSSDPELFEVIEPLSRIVGWVEATSYFLDVTTQRDAVRTLYGGMQLEPSER